MIDTERMGRIEDAAAPAPPPAWRRCRDLVSDILERSRDPWVKLQLSGDVLHEVRQGGIVLLIGGTGRGKTSLAVSFLVEHALCAGPAISMSLELPADEWTARAIGMNSGSSWPAVLKGELTAEQMRDALPDRLAIIDRRKATLAVLAEAIAALRAESPTQPILVAVDYVQLANLGTQTEIRQRVGETMEKLSDFAREHRVVLIALSQGSRASSKSLASGEKLGLETADTGAEAAELERWSTVTLAIGQFGPAAEDGTVPVDLSNGKGRMGNGDMVHPARYDGRTGRWRIEGKAKPAAQVRDQRKADSDSKRVNAAKLAMIAAATRSKEPVTRDELRIAAHAQRGVAKAAIDELLDSGELVEVERKKPRSKDWKLWTIAKANESGIPIRKSAMDAADEILNKEAA